MIWHGLSKERGSFFRGLNSKENLWWVIMEPSEHNFWVIFFLSNEKIEKWNNSYMALSRYRSWWRSNMVTFRLFWLKPIVKKGKKKDFLSHSSTLNTHRHRHTHRHHRRMASFKVTLTLYYRWCLPSGFCSPFLSYLKCWLWPINWYHNLKMSCDIQF